MATIKIIEMLRMGRFTFTFYSSGLYKNWAHSRSPTVQQFAALFMFYKCFSDDEHVIGDTGFIGFALIVCYYKRNQGQNDPERRSINREIRSQRWLNGY